MRAKTIEPLPWPWPDRPRALIENRDRQTALSTASALRQAGYAVAVCRGPNERSRCPLVEGTSCVLVEGADVVVSDVGCDVVEALRIFHPTMPIVTATPSDEVVAAVADALR